MDLHKTPLFAESWNVAYRKKTGSEPLEDTQTPFIVIPNTCRYWAADPFVFEQDGEVYIFAVLYDYLKCRGVLGYYRLNDETAGWKPVIEEDHHLSYPCIFRENGEIFILPESFESEQVYLYRAVGFPDVWERDTVLRRNVRYVDTTPFRIGERKLALTYDDSGHRLFLLDLDNGTDAPIDLPDRERRRPAGYMDAREKVRMAQDCAEGYGKGLILYRFKVDPTGYSEEFVKRVTPDMLRYSRKLYLDGLHTYNRSEHYEVIDIKTRRFNVLNFAVRICRSLGRRLSHRIKSAP